MAKLLDKIRNRRKRKGILRDLVLKGEISKVFTPYYLNDEKIDHFFQQEYGGITEFTKTHAHAINSKLDLGIKNTNLLALLAELNANIGFGSEWSNGETEKSHVPTILRFNILRMYWEFQKRLVSLDHNPKGEAPKSHTLIAQSGKFYFSENVEELIPPLSLNQSLSVKKQQNFENKAENINHYLYLVTSPFLAISIISSSFMTSSGFRFLPHYSSQDSNTLFVGSVIGFKEDILFLNPIGIGEDVNL